jgi:hypothetical protein
LPIAVKIVACISVMFTGSLITTKGAGFGGDARLGGDRLPFSWAMPTWNRSPTTTSREATAYMLKNSHIEQ